MKTTDDERASLKAAFAASNANADLEGLPFTDAMCLRQARIIAGKLTFDEAIAEIIAALAQR